MNKFGVKTPLHHLRSGHVAVDVLSFDSNGWSLPDDSACAHRKTADFLCDPTAMIAEVHYSSEVQGAPQSHHRCRAGHGSDPPHTLCQSAGASCDCWWWFGEKSSKSMEKLEGCPAEDLRSAGVCRRPSKARVMARRWVILWLCSAMCVTGARLGPLITARACLQGEEVQGGGVPRDDPP